MQATNEKLIKRKEFLKRMTKVMETQENPILKRDIPLAIKTFSFTYSN